MSNEFEAEVICDWDETLVATKETVMTAYEQAGVDRKTIEENWGLPAVDWTSPEIHRRKQRIYKELLDKETPSFTWLGHALMDRTSGLPEIKILTSASHEAVRFLWHRLTRHYPHIPPMMVMQAGAAISAKAVVLDIRGHTKKILYLDDSLDNIQFLRDSLNPDSDVTLGLVEHMPREITLFGKVDKWTLSFWQQELIRVCKGSCQLTINP